MNENTPSENKYNITQLLQRSAIALVRGVRGCAKSSASQLERRAQGEGWDGLGQKMSNQKRNARRAETSKSESLREHPVIPAALTANHIDSPISRSSPFT
jgi:hypothetical protein